MKFDWKGFIIFALIMYLANMATTYLDEYLNLSAQYELGIYAIIILPALFGYIIWTNYGAKAKDAV